MLVKTSGGLVEEVDLTEPANMERKSVNISMQAQFGEKYGSDFAPGTDAAGNLNSAQLEQPAAP